MNFSITTKKKCNLKIDKAKSTNDRLFLCTMALMDKLKTSCSLPHTLPHRKETSGKQRIRGFGHSSTSSSAQDRTQLKCIKAPMDNTENFLQSTTHPKAHLNCSITPSERPRILWPQHVQVHERETLGQRQNVYGSTKETMMYLTPLVVLSPSCQWVTLPGCIRVQPCFPFVNEQLYLKKLVPPPCT